MPSAIGMMMVSYPTSYNGGDHTSSVRKGKGKGKAQIKKERDQGFVIPLYLHPPTLPPPRTKPRRRPKKKTARPSPPFCPHHEILHNRHHHHHHHRHQDHGQLPPRHHPTCPLSSEKERGPIEVGGHENQEGQGPTRTSNSNSNNIIGGGCSCNSNNRLSCTTSISSNSSSSSSSDSSTCNDRDNNSIGSNGRLGDISLGLLIQKAWAFRTKSILHPDSSSSSDTGSSCTSDLSCSTSSSSSSNCSSTCSSTCKYGSNNPFGTLQVLLGSMLPLKRERNGQQNRGHCICCCSNQCDPVSCTDSATSLATGPRTANRPLVSAMKRAGQPPRAILSAPGNGRVSFECDLIDKNTRPHQHPTTASNNGRFTPPTAAKTEPLSSSAPSALFLYQPFSSDKGPPSPLVKDLNRPQSRKKRLVGGFDQFDSTTNATTATVGGGREERTRLVPLNLTTNGNDNDYDNDYDNNDVTTKVQDQVVPQEQTFAQQHQPVRASTTTKTTATTAPSTTMTAPTRASLLSSTSTTIAPSSSPATVVSTTGPSTTPIVSSPSAPLARVGSKTKTSSHQSTKEQRRQSSEDGLTAPTTHELAIPTKCRMVFHMRDEVSKVKGHCTADGGSANFRPLPQPRQWQSVPQYPLRATTSLKTTKTVSFQEPEPWRKRCSEEILSTSFVLNSKDSYEASHQQPAILATRPTFESKHSDSHQPILTSEKAASEGCAKMENATTATATAATNIATRPPPASAPALRSCAALEHRGHVRNLSAPSPSVGSSVTMTRTPTSNSSASYNDNSIANGTGQGSPPASSGGNRFSRLWKSMAQKVGNGHSHNHRHPHENNGYSTNKHHHHIHHSQIAQGSDVEPLVVKAN